MRHKFVGQNTPKLKAGDSPRFQTTHWSVVLAAGTSDSAKSNRALGNLCQIYWYPIFAFVRRCGYQGPDAQDLTQGFFLQLIERQAFRAVRSEYGRFRSFLLVCLKHYLADEYNRSQTQKRGGGRTIVSYDAQKAEERYAMEPMHLETPDKLFERRWVMQLLDAVLDELENYFREKGKLDLFGELRRFIVNDGADGDSYSDAATRLGMSEEAFKKSVQRFRHRYQGYLREKIAQTVSAPQDVEDEYRHLRQILAS